jgi:hypothetical protein
VALPHAVVVAPYSGALKPHLDALCNFIFHFFEFHGTRGHTQGSEPRPQESHSCHQLPPWDRSCHLLLCLALQASLSLLLALPAEGDLCTLPPWREGGRGAGAEPVAPLWDLGVASGTGGP